LTEFLLSLFFFSFLIGSSHCGTSPDSSPPPFFQFSCRMHLLSSLVGCSDADRGFPLSSNLLSSSWIPSKVLLTYFWVLSKGAMEFLFFPSLHPGKMTQYRFHSSGMHLLGSFEIRRRTQFREGVHGCPMDRPPPSSFARPFIIALPLIHGH